MHFGQLFKAYDNNYFAKIACILSNFLNVSKYFIFLVKSFLGNFYRHLATFFTGHGWERKEQQKSSSSIEWKFDEYERKQKGSNEKVVVVWTEQILERRKWKWVIFYALFFILKVILGTYENFQLRCARWQCDQMLE